MRDVLYHTESALKFKSVCHGVSILITSVCGCVRSAERMPCHANTHRQGDSAVPKLVICLRPALAFPLLRRTASIRNLPARAAINSVSTKRAPESEP